MQSDVPCCRTDQIDQRSKQEVKSRQLSKQQKGTDGSIVKVYLEKTIFSEGHKGNGGSRDEDSCNWDEAADEDKQSQQADPRDCQEPHAQCCQCCVGHCYLCLNKHHRTCIKML